MAAHRPDSATLSMDSSARGVQGSMFKVEIRKRGEPLQYSQRSLTLNFEPT
jgi:hypothetical protein